jgi:hypothetical protein
MTGPRDWDRELAAIDRAIERAPAPPAGSPAATPPPAGAAVVRGAARRAWGRLIPVLALAVALPFWPYSRGCGLGLALYLAGVAVLAAAGAWAAASAWRHRRSAAHVLALGAIVWSGALAAREVLPRIGYASVPAAWTC